MSAVTQGVDHTRPRTGGAQTKRKGLGLQGVRLFVGPVCRYAPSVNTPATTLERHSGKVMLLILLVMFVGMDLVAGRLVRHFGLRAWEAQISTFKTYRESSPIFHHGLRPNRRVQAMWGGLHYPLVTNELGFVSTSTGAVTRQWPGRRVLFMGDSFTEGIGVEYTKTWVGLASAELAKRGIATLDGAAVSYSPVIYYTKVKHLIEQEHLEFDDLVVFIDISDASDEVFEYMLDADGHVVNRAPKVANPPPVTKNYRQRPAILELLERRTLFTHSLVWSAMNGTLAIAPQDTLKVVDLTRSGWTFDPELRESYGRRGLELMTASMDQLAALAEAHHTRLTIAVFPWPGQILFDTTESPQPTHWRAWAEAHHAGFIDYFPDFMPAAPEARRDLIEAEFIPGDMHWNEAGHRRIAEKFLRYYQPLPAPNAVMAL